LLINVDSLKKLELFKTRKNNRVASDFKSNLEEDVLLDDV